MVKLMNKQSGAVIRSKKRVSYEGKTAGFRVGFDRLGFHFTNPVKNNGEYANYFKALEWIAENPGTNRNEIRQAANYPYNHGWESFFEAATNMNLIVSNKGKYSLTAAGADYVSKVRSGFNRWTLSDTSKVKKN